MVLEIPCYFYINRQFATHISAWSKQQEVIGERKYREFVISIFYPEAELDYISHVLHLSLKGSEPRLYTLCDPTLTPIASF